MKAGLFYLEFLRDMVRRVDGGDEEESGNLDGVSQTPETANAPKASPEKRKRKYATLDRKMKELKKTLEKVLLPQLEKPELEKRLREFFKEQKDKEGLRDVKKTVEEYADKQHELFKILHNSYPGADLAWFTSDPELYKLSKGNDKKKAKGALDTYVPTGFAQTLNAQQVCRGY